jgi:aromatic ring-opening dioxygenase catalytic subunit (LigB family)
MLTARVWLAPHLSTLLVDQHRGHRTEMLQALASAARGFEAEQPAAIVALSARWEAPGPFLADEGRQHATLTDYYGFGVEVRYDCAGSTALARALVDVARAGGVRAATTLRGVDSGVSVPLHFLAPRRAVPVVPVSLARRTGAEHRAWGAALRRALDGRPERIAFVVGGMLSHNVHAWNLRREIPEARALDERVLEALRAGTWDGLARIESRPHAQARPEANLMHLEVLRGLLGGDLPGQVLCYEPGPGVGAALVQFLVGEPAPLPPMEAEPAQAPRHAWERRRPSTLWSGTTRGGARPRPRAGTPVGRGRESSRGPRPRPRPAAPAGRGRESFRGPRPRPRPAAPVGRGRESFRGPAGVAPRARAGAGPGARAGMAPRGRQQAGRDGPRRERPQTGRAGPAPRRTNVRPGPGSGAGSAGRTGRDRRPQAGAGRDRRPQTNAGRDRRPQAGAGRDRRPQTNAGRDRRPQTNAGRDRRPQGGAGRDRRPQTGAGRGRPPRPR